MNHFDKFLEIYCDKSFKLRKDTYLVQEYESKSEESFFNYLVKQKIKQRILEVIESKILIPSQLFKLFSKKQQENYDKERVELKNVISKRNKHIERIIKELDYFFKKIDKDFYQVVKDVGSENIDDTFQIKYSNYTKKISKVRRTRQCVIDFLKKSDCFSGIFFVLIWGVSLIFNIENKKYKYLPYSRLFENTEMINIKDYGDFDVYPNRDSLKYREIYGLEDISTMIRGTIRKVGFPKSWNMLVRLGLTDDSFKISNSQGMTYREYLNCFLPYHKSLTIEDKTKKMLKINEGDSQWMKLNEIDLFSKTKKIPLKNASPAQILEHILKEAWQLEDNDKDMIVMYHEFKFRDNLNKEKTIVSTMGCIGEDSTFTAMAKTVGLPLAISCLMILNGQINSLGVQTPVNKEIYEPVLKELESFGILFNEI